VDSVNNSHELFSFVLQLMESSGVTVMADAQFPAQTRVQVLLEFLHEKEMDLEDLAEMRRVRLEQALQLGQFQSDANQVHIPTYFTDDHSTILCFN
jgi:hypothetical protein